MGEQLLDWLGGYGPALLYTLLGAGAAVENVVPPIPADTFVVLGGVLSARGVVDPVTVFFVTWGANVLSAIAVYAAGYRFGRPFFEGSIGSRLLRPRQLDRMGRFLSRWGLPALFLARFLPGLRAIVPAFAGITHQRVLPVVLPITVASAIWYGVLVWAGFTFGNNLDLVLGWLRGVNRGLLLAAALIFLGLGLWWWRSRHPREGGSADRAGPDE